MDPWRVLGVSPGADPATVHAAYRRLAWRHHPDHGGSTARMRELNAAYAALRRIAGIHATAAPGQAPRSASGASPTGRPATGPAQERCVRARAAAWLVTTGPGQWLGCLLLVAGVHGIALLGSSRAWSPLELLAAFLVLRLHVRAVPDAHPYAPAEAAGALLVGALRLGTWLARRW